MGSGKGAIKPIARVTVPGASRHQFDRRVLLLDGSLTPSPRPANYTDFISIIDFFYP